MLQSANPGIISLDIKIHLSYWAKIWPKQSALWMKFVCPQVRLSQTEPAYHLWRGVIALGYGHLQKKGAPAEERVI